MTFSSFAKGKKDVLNTEPCKYDLPSTIGNGPKFSIGIKHKEYDKEKTAEYYSIPSTLEKKGVKLASRKKRGEEKIEKGSYSPGPTYFPSTIGTGRKSSIKGRVEKKEEITPGPGEYSPSLNSYTRGVSIGTGKRFDFVQDNTIVAPGSYDVPSTISTRDLPPSLPKRGKTKQPFQKKQHPGPIYDTSAPIGSKSPKISFSRASRDYYIEKTPGPGDYEVSKPFGDTSRVATALHGRPKIPENEEHSLPYYYIGSTIKIRPKTIGSRPRTSYETDSPGPQYDVGGTIKPKKISLAGRPPIKDPKADLPSPDTYFGSSVFSPPSVVCGFHGPVSRSIINEKETGSIPGPGQYNITDRPSSKAYSLRSRIDLYSEPDTSAPYLQMPSTLSGPAYSIGLRDV